MSSGCCGWTRSGAIRCCARGYTSPMKDAVYDAAAERLETALREQFPATAWTVERSQSAMIDAELTEVPWEVRRRRLMIMAERDGYAYWFPSPFTAEIDDVAELAAMVGRLGENMLASYQAT